MRKLVLVSVVLGSLLAASSAHAAIPDVFGGSVSCSVVGDQRQCGAGDLLPTDIRPGFSGSAHGIMVKGNSHSHFRCARFPFL